MMNDIQKRILAEAVKFGGSDISKIQTIANTLSEMPMVDSPSSAGTLFGHSATQFEVKMRQVMKKMGYEKGILGMKLYGSLMHIWFANEGKAKDFVLVLNQMTRRVSTGTVAIHSTMFDPKTEKQFTGAKAKVIVNFSKIKKEEFETEDGLMTFLESESETVCVEDIEEVVSEAKQAPQITEKMIRDGMGWNDIEILRSGWCADSKCNKAWYAVVFTANKRVWWGEINGIDHYPTCTDMGPKSMYKKALTKFDKPGDWKNTMPKSAMKEEVDDGESIEEAFSPDQVPAHLLGGRFRNEKDKIFEYRLSTDAWGLKHGLPHEIFVLDGKQTRAGLIKGTVAYISTDEDAEGKPVLQKWKIKQHVKYLKHYESTESTETLENNKSIQEENL